MNGEEGPPQEGLDPKLKILTDLAPADEAEAEAVEASIFEFGASIDVPDVDDGGPPVVDVEEAVVGVVGAPSEQVEQPPQFGQDPKLLDCVNDGDENNAREEENFLDTAAAAAAAAADAAAASDALAAGGMPNDKAGPAVSAIAVGDQAMASGDADEAIKADLLAPPSPTKATVAATMLDIHRNPAETQNEDSASAVEPSPVNVVKAEPEERKANANPNLNSAESLAEWNKIHSNTGPTYNFFRKSQGGQMMAALPTETKKEPPTAATDGGLNPKVEDPMAAAAAAASIPVEQKQPLFILDANGIPSVIPPAHEQGRQLPPLVHTVPGTFNPLAPPAPFGAAIPALHPHAMHPTAGSPLPPGAVDDALGRTNSNFWLQEEEERFLLGLRLYGWGQWKRIQTIVQTRSNKQIKSHAQKREKVNPDIKLKYGKGKSRRGRISSKVLAEDARAMAIAGGSVGQVADAILQNDASIPSLDQAWKDVYGTNNTDGPNSRTRRYRPHSKFAGDQADRGGQLALLELSKQSGEGEVSLGGANLVAMAPQRSLKESLENPMLKNPVGAPMEHYHQHKPPAIHDPRDMYPRAPTHQQISENQESSHMPSLPPMNQPPSLSPPTAAATTAPQKSPSKHIDTTTLRPGMRIYSRMGQTWTPGTIYSAKVDSTKLADQQGSTVPLVYHIQFDNGNEDPNVPEENLMSKPFYEDAIIELEKCHAMPRTANIEHSTTHPLVNGTPVYCQWMDSNLPEMHGRWLPGTINSMQKLNELEFSYHILFDNEQEKQGIPQQYVLDRAAYHELTKIKYQSPQEEGTRPIGEIYNLFLRKENASTGENVETADQLQQQQEQQHQQQPGIIQGSAVSENANSNDPDQTENGGQLDLLSMASHIATSHGPAQPAAGEPIAAVAMKREATMDIDNRDHKRQREQQETAKEEHPAVGPDEPAGTVAIV